VHLLRPDRVVGTRRIFGRRRKKGIIIIIIIIIVRGPPTALDSEHVHEDKNTVPNALSESHRMVHMRSNRVRFRAHGAREKLHQF
jgi:hypothetical protein